MRLRGTAYVCPVLMNLTILLLRLRGRFVHWKMVSDFWRVIESRPGLGHGWERTCIFPVWMIEAEYRWWNSRPGLRMRKAMGM